MKILHVSKYYYPYLGGVENICKYLVEGMPEGYDTAVVCFNEGRRDAVDWVNGHRVYRVGSWFNIARQALSLSYFGVLRKAIREFKPDVVQLHWANPYPASVLLSLIPQQVGLIVHWHMDIIKQRHIYPLIRPVETALLRRANMVVVTSPQYRDGSTPLQPFRDKVEVVQNAMDVDTFSWRKGDEEGVEAVRQRYGGRKVVFFVGRHIEYKGLPLLIEAEKFIKGECEIVVAGQGPLTEGLKARCKSPRVHFVGRLNDDELRWHHYAASVFAFPSITKNEAFGVALAEAMYCLTPAVTFTIPGSGVNWVNLHGVTGIEVPNGDAKAFAEAVDKLLADECLSARYAEAARQRVIDNFTIDKMINEMQRCYNALSVNKTKRGGVKVRFLIPAALYAERRAA